MFKSWPRPLLFATTLLALPIAMAQPASTDNYPTSQIELVLPNTPGGGTDAIARIIAPALSKRLGQNVIITYKPGAASLIAAEHVKRAKPDGHTLLAIHSGVLAEPFNNKNFKVDWIEDFSWIAALSGTPWVIAVNSSVPARTFEELLAYGKANPDKLNLGSTGGAIDLSIAALKRRTGLDVQPVLYPGASQIITAFLGNEIQMVWNAMRGIRPLLDRGVHPIAVTSPTRSRLAPTIPTLQESGVAGFSTPSLWFGVIGPAGMPAPIVDRLNREINAILQSPETSKLIEESLSQEPIVQSPAEVRETAARETRFYRDVSSK